MSSTPWLIRPSGAAARRLQLVCLPYAGGSANAFLPWQPLLAPDIGLCAVQPPGRGARFGEAPYTTLPALVAALAEVLRQHVAPPYALFGHSLGSLVAFELARHCRAHGLPPPQQLIVSAGSAPMQRTPRRLHELDDDALIAALRDYNGAPPSALEHRELMELMLPTIRADFALLADYRYRKEAPLALPITVFAGKDDAHAPADSLTGWQECSSQPVACHWFDGDHFFLHAHGAAVVERINALVAPRGYA